MDGCCSEHKTGQLQHHVLWFPWDVRLMTVAAGERALTDGMGTSLSSVFPLGFASGCVT
jgi:hypothetical protein